MKKTATRILQVTALAMGLSSYYACKPPAQSGLRGTDGEQLSEGLAVGFPQFLTSNSTPGCPASGAIVRMSRNLDGEGPSLRNHRVCFRSVNLANKIYSNNGDFESELKYVLAPREEIEIQKEKVTIFQLCSEQAAYVAYIKVKSSDMQKPVKICSIDKAQLEKIKFLAMRPNRQKNEELTLYQFDLSWLEDLPNLESLTIHNARIYSVETLAKFEKLQKLALENVLMPEEFTNNLSFLQHTAGLKSFAYKPILTRAELINTDGLSYIPLTEELDISIPGETYKSIEGLKNLRLLIQSNHFIGLGHESVLKAPMPFSFFFRSYGVSYLDWIEEVSL